MPLDAGLGMLFGGLASGTSSGLLGLAGGNKGGGYKDPDLLDPSSLFNIITGFLSNRAYRKAFNEYADATDEDIESLRALSDESADKTLKTYDESAIRSFQEITGLSGRQTRDAIKLYKETQGNADQFLEGFQERGLGTQQGYGAGMSQFMGSLQSGGDDVISSFDDRYKFAENELKGYGDQAKADIERTFQERSDALASDLVTRGVASSTQAAKEQLLNTELQSQEQRRLADDLARNRINVLGGIMGEKTAAEERQLGRESQYGFQGMQSAFANQTALDSAEAAYEAAMRGDVLNARKFMMEVDAQNSGNVANWWSTNAANRSNITRGGYQDRMNAITAVSRVPPPSPAGTLQQLGANTAGYPQPTSQGSYALAAAAPGISQGVGAAFQNWWNRPPPTPVTSQNTNYSPYVSWPINTPTFDPSTGYGAGGWGPPAW